MNSYLYSDILFTIFSFSNDTSLLNVSLVDKYWNNILNSEYFWEKRCSKNMNVKNLKMYKEIISKNLTEHQQTQTSSSEKSLLLKYLYFKTRNLPQKMKLQKKDKHFKKIGNSQYEYCLNGIDKSLQADRGIKLLNFGLVLFYFEVELINPNNFNSLSIGIAHENYRKDYQVGWGRGSIGYHGDDGAIYFENELESLEMTNTFNTGDTIGCGIYAKTNELFFTKNGTFMGNKCKINTPKNIYPTVGFFGKGRVDVNFGKKPFKFNIAELVNMESVIFQKKNYSIPSLRSAKLPRRYQDYIIDFPEEERNNTQLHSNSKRRKIVKVK